MKTVLIKVLLLSNNGYPDMSDVCFPVEVTGWFDEEHEIFNILGSEVIRIAGQCRVDPWDPDFWYAFDPEYIEMKEGNIK